jgi:AcrR family transcriptional regulator
MAKPTLSLRERQKIATRGLLLEAAGELFAEKGYPATSIDDICAAAGVSRATLYAYFDGKEALLGGIVERMWVDAQIHYDDFGRLPDWSRGSILGWMRNFADAWTRDAPRNKAAVAASPSLFLGSSEPIEWRRKQREAVRSDSARWQHFTDHEAEMRAAMIVDVIEGQFAAFFFESMPVQLDEFLGYVTDAVRLLLGER